MSWYHYALIGLFSVLGTGTVVWLLRELEQALQWLSEPEHGMSMDLNDRDLTLASEELLAR